MGCWTVRRLSLIGKITVLKSLAASQVTHLLSPLQIDSQIIKQINDLFFDFLWNGKGDKIKRNVITQNYGNGGLRMIDIASFNKALKSVWIRKYLDESTVQLRYIRTAHTHFIRAYFAYTRMSIRAHVRVYTRTYARIYARIWSFVMHSHKFLYLKHCLSNKGHLWK